MEYITLSANQRGESSIRRPLILDKVEITLRLQTIQFTWIEWYTYHSPYPLFYS